MATSCCPKCGKTSFEIKEHEFNRPVYVLLFFVQCSSCGCVVGISDYPQINEVSVAISE